MDSVGRGERHTGYTTSPDTWRRQDHSQYLYGIGKPAVPRREAVLAHRAQRPHRRGRCRKPRNYTFATLGGVGQPRELPPPSSTSSATATTTSRWSTGRSTAATPRLQRLPRRGRPGAASTDIPRALYNTTSYIYTDFNARAAQLNYTLMIFFPERRYEGVIIMPNGLYNSNLFKLVWLCNQYQCPYGNSSAKLSPSTSTTTPGSTG